MSRIKLEFRRNVDYRAIHVDTKFPTHYTVSYAHDICDWERLYKNHDLISPRMAYRLSIAGHILSDETCSWDEQYNMNAWLHPDRKYDHIFLYNGKWQSAFSAAIERICLRLYKGLGLNTNCIAEQRAIYIMVLDAASRYNERQENFHTRSVQEFRPYGCKYMDFKMLPKDPSKDINFNSILLSSKRYAPYAKFYEVHPQKWFLCFDNSCKRVLDYVVERKDIHHIKRTKRCYMCWNKKPENGKMYRCRGCRYEYGIYCSRRCQKKHWIKQHRWHCDSTRDNEEYYRKDGHSLCCETM